MWLITCIVLFQNARQANELLDILKEANQQISPELLDLAQMAKTMQMEKGKSSKPRTHKYRHYNIGQLPPHDFHYYCVCLYSTIKVWQVL